MRQQRRGAVLGRMLVIMALGAAALGAASAAAAPAPIVISSNLGSPSSECAAFAGYIGLDLALVASIEDPPGSGGGVSVSGGPGAISWSSGSLVHAAFVKAGQGGHLYLYPSGALSDSGLTSPRNSTSHVTFCAATNPPPAATATPTATPTHTPTPTATPTATPTHTPVTPEADVPTPKQSATPEKSVTPKEAPTAKVLPTATPKTTPDSDELPASETVTATPTATPTTTDVILPPTTPATTATPTPVVNGRAPEPLPAPTLTPTPTTVVVVLPDTRAVPAPSPTEDRFVIPGLPTTTPTPGAEVLGKITPREGSGALAITGFAGLSLAFAGVALISAGFLFLAKRRSLGT